MGFTDAVRTCFRKYVTFSGRAARPEYWWFILFVVIMNLVLSLLDRVLFGVSPVTGAGRSVLSTLFSLAVFLPSLAVGWRRMHDSGRPGWLLLIPFVITIAGGIFIGVTLVAGISAGGPGGGALAALGVGGAIIYAIVQIALLILMIWWLTRPTEPGDNQYGPPPQ